MPAPANDNFASATVISGTSGTDGPVTVTDATTEGSEPLVGLGGFRQTVWFSWTAPASGVVRLFLHPELGSISGLVAGWSGSGYGGLTNLGPGPFSASPVSSGAEGIAFIFTAVSGTTYHYQVGASDGGSPATGTIAIRWEMIDPPANDDFADALALSPDTPVGPINVVAATVEADEPSPSVMSGDGPFQTSWYEWTSDAFSVAELDLTGTVGDSGGGFNEWIIAVYKALGAGNVLEVDATAADAYTEIDLGSDHSEIWVTFDLGLSPATVLAYCANAIVSLWDSSANFGTGAGFIEGAYPCGFGSVPGCWSDDAANNFSDSAPQVGQRCELHYKSDGTFRFYVNGIVVMSDAGTPWPMSSVRHVLFGLKPLVGPVADAVFLFDNIMVGTARGTGDLFTNNGSISGWTSTTGSVAAVARPWWMLEEIASRDLGGTTLSFDADPGATYRIQVGTWGDYDTATVSLVLSLVDRQPNDDLADVITLAWPSGTVEGSTHVATFDDPFDPFGDSEPSPAGSVWYRLLLPASWNDASAATFSLESHDADVLSALPFFATTWPPTEEADITRLINLESGGTVGGDISFTFEITGFARPADGYLYIGVVGQK